MTKRHAPWQAVISRFQQWEPRRRWRLAASMLLAVSLIAGTGLAPAAGAGQAEARRPNVVIFFADDQGYADLGCFGSEIVRTPVIDALAKGGARFTDFYAGSAVCSPSRASMLTGRFALRASVYSWIHPSQTMHLLQDEISYARMLQQAGYATAHMGKWHLGYSFYRGTGEGPASGGGPTRLDPARPGPDLFDHGFDYWVATGNNAVPSHRNPENFVRNGQAVGPTEGYSSHLMVDEAINWLDEHRDPERPFLLNVWFNEPHGSGGPTAPPEFTQRHADRPRPGYYAAIEYMDLAVGRLMNKLEELNETNNTLVVFTSDNGSYMDGSNDPFRGRKTTLWEGGIRVPAVFYWPGVIEPGTIVTEPAGVVDILPTLAAVAGVDVPDDRTIDGVSLLPALRGERLIRETPLYWFYSPSRPVCVIRQGDWSLVANPVIDLPRQNMFEEAFIGDIKATELTDFRLYHLRKDPGQQHDLAEQHPERFEAMKRTMQQLHREIMDEALDWREFEWRQKR